MRKTTISKVISMRWARKVDAVVTAVADQTIFL